MKRYAILPLLIAIFLISQNISHSEHFWRTLPSPYSGDIRHLKFNPKGNLYAVAWGKGILRLADVGFNWKEVNKGLLIKYVMAIEFDSLGNMYACTFGGGIFRSGNNGDSWTQINNGLKNLNVKSICYSKSGNLFAGTYGGGVFRSSNSGDSWESVNTNLWYMDINALTACEDGSILAGTNGDGIYKTNNNGNYWRRSNNGLVGTAINCFAINRSNEVFTATDDGDVFFSVSYGAAWILYCSSTEYIDSLSKKKYEPAKNITSMVFNKESELVIATADIGIWKYNWINEKWAKTNLEVEGVTSIAVNSKWELFATIQEGGIWKSIDNGKNWFYFDLKESSWINYIAAFRNNLIFASVKNKSGADVLYRSLDNGNNWEKMVFYPEVTQIVCMAQDSAGNLFTGTGKGLYRSNDSGLTWAQSGFEKNRIGGINVSYNGGIMIILNKGTQDKDTGEIYQSYDNGWGWSKLSSFNHEISCIATDFIGNIYIGATIIDKTIPTDVKVIAQILKTTDYGISWFKVLERKSPSYICNKFNNICIDKNNSVYLSAKEGILFSKTGGSRWSSYNLNMQYPDVPVIAFTPESWLYAIYDRYNAALLYGFSWFHKKINSGISNGLLRYLTLSPEGRLYVSNNSIYYAVDEPSILAPEMKYPINYETAVPINPTMTWYQADKADLYELQVYSSPQFQDSCKMEKVVQSDTSRKLIRTLNYNTRYYWKVRSKTNSNYSSWQQYREFITVFEPPELQSPENDIACLDTNIVLKWHSINIAIHYNLEIASDTNFQNVIFRKEKLKDTIIKISGLLTGTKYFWRIQAFSQHNNSAWSEIRKFETKFIPPMLVEPPDSTINHPLNVTMRWNSIPGAENYRIQLAKDRNFEKMVFDGLAEDQNQKQIDILEYDTKYFWRIKAVSEKCESDWSEIWNYQTALLPTELILPPDSISGLKGIITCVWKPHSNVTSYHIQIAKDYKFKNIVFEDSLAKQSEIQVINLEFYKTFYWRVRIRLNEKAGVWSDIWQFSTGLAYPILSKPENNSENAPNTIYLIWLSTEGANVYHLQVSKSNEFDTLIYEKDSIADVKRDVYNLDYNTIYFWRVKAKDDYGESPWSKIWNFKTQRTQNQQSKSSIHKSGFMPILIRLIRISH